MSTGTNKIRTIKKIDSSEPEFNAEIKRIDDQNSDGKYIITAERMDDVNWRDDDSLSFAKSQDPTPPRSDGSRTILKTTADGRTWLAIPNLSEPLELAGTVPCTIRTNGSIVSVFETNTKQDGLSTEQLSNIEAVPNKADRSVVDNKVDIRAVTYTDAQKTQARNNIAAASITQGTKADNSVQFVSQTLTDAQKTLARNNIAAASTAQGTRADTAVQRIAGNQITVPTTPSAATDATSKAYVDGEITNRINKIYPVGSIYISANNTNPSATIGIGTWEPFGAGKVLVGVDVTDSDFNTPLKTGGAKTHTLTAAQMPAHAHGMNGHTHNTPNHTHNTDSKLNNSELRESIHAFDRGNFQPNGDIFRGNETSAQFGDQNSGGVAALFKLTHSHSIPSSGSGTTGGSAADSTLVGGGGAHNNVQPYIAVHMWRRTA